MFQEQRRGINLQWLNFQVQYPFISECLKIINVLLVVYALFHLVGFSRTKTVEILEAAPGITEDETEPTLWLNELLENVDAEFKPTTLAYVDYDQFKTATHSAKEDGGGGESIPMLLVNENNEDHIEDILAVFSKLPLRSLYAHRVR